MYQPEKLGDVKSPPKGYQFILTRQEIKMILKGKTLRLPNIKTENGEELALFLRRGVKQP